MVSDLFFYPLALIALLWLCLMLLGPGQATVLVRAQRHPNRRQHGASAAAPPNLLRA